MARDILHIDMDAFYAAIEQRDNPQWRGKPLVVGARPEQRGVVSTCSYEARTYGIHSAMSSVEAGRRCPHAIFVPPDMSRYAAVSQHIFTIFEQFTPLVEPLSIDEAFLDITGSHALFGDNQTMALKIQAAISNETGGLTASIGIANNKFLAKLASDMKKPNGITIVPYDHNAIIQFLAPLPIGRIWGIGTVTRTHLERYGYKTIADIQRSSVAALRPLVGEANAWRIYSLAHGEDEREVITDTSEKSLSREHTFDTDCADPKHLRAMLYALTEDVGRRLRASKRYATTARIKLRWSDFKTITRQISFDQAVSDDFTLREAAALLFDNEQLIKPVRLIGFGVFGLTTTRITQQLLFDNNSDTLKKRETLSETVDALRQRFGSSLIQHPGTIPIDD